MSTSDSSLEEETFEEEEDEQDSYYFFGIEPNRTYSGQQMEELDKLFDTDKEEGQLILKPDMVLSHRYQIKTMIGRGTFCLVWLAYDYLRCENVAIKVLKKCDDSVGDDGQFEDEFVMNQYLSTVDEEECQNITRFYDVFYFEGHCCLVFELVSQNILTFINYFDYTFVRIPLPLVKKIVIDTLKGLNYMHKHGTIHTDLKPENVFAVRPIFPYEPFSEDDTREVFNCLEDDPSTISFKLGDFGNSCFDDGMLNELIQTRQYRSPEVLLGIDYNSSADIWSLACMTFELATRHHLFDPVIGDIEEDNDNKEMFDAVHLSMIEMVMGPIPRDWARNGKCYTKLYNSRGDLKYKYEKRMGPVYDLLVKHGLSQQDAQELSDFLQPMLAIIPRQRPSAAELLDSPWLYLP